MPKSQIYLMTVNLDAAKLRHDQMEGREYLVAPMVMLTEGVHQGNNGPLLYPPDELSKTPVTWNHKPIVVYHPKENGVGVSACSPHILTSRKVGVVMNTVWDDENKRLKAEAWFEKDRLNKVDDRILPILEKGEPMELSTGVFSDNEDTAGIWNDEEYVGIARNYRADHLAVLPDQIGACSLKDGAGLMINEQSFGEIESDIRKELQSRFINNDEEKFLWVMDVFSTFSIHERDDKLWKVSYTKKDDKVILGTEDPVEVVRSIQYSTTTGELIANSAFPLENRKESEMTPEEKKKEELVDGLIANEKTQWAEDDKDFLLKMDDARLAKLTPITNDDDEKKEEAKKKEAADLIANATKAAADKKLKDEGKKVPLTVEEYVNNAEMPAEVRDMIQQGLTARTNERKILIDAITANEKNGFEESWLENQPTDVLLGMAKLATNDVVPTAEGGNILKPMFYGGAQGASPTQNRFEEEEITAEDQLVAPTLNFEKQTA